ncbi:glucosamine-6-phosphate isomerase [Aggregatibacter actinomycetemcomitans serotype e str. SC1083]|uniref:Glucosamine-6-phosphate deaminase n=1 Tax=Aggregatibacter actinomycetemcomitans serotype e str. SC1083 TaxID=907488 RepID=G4A8B9_AGGAC|nr:glucosamine-6-phosphate deaminase [Aggregatibacter actinomycetemcomitans]EGY34085.1 glucosamine-6-phosphate isomerase [Aggregatibacter actinomycetemcomitans serotype e str. SC1083]KYK76552.1 glucosamine-6-phosphate deaminase [Aggregatibacter actinomycetemcomitans serotype e str. SA3096]KYK79769.1 glucosamine-6-phosphate deaminase [Aggregatibacter actinomycetemcomitans serotype e str. SC936]KYK96369.1 glucosamine-6-phosphate deaminase [Aggregatibacter actinomycetemcomitans serotype e str. ANH
MRLIPLTTEQQVSRWAARHIVDRINQFKPTEDRPFVLGLPTGSTPLKTYQELIKLYQAGEVSFKHVVTFNMDEYVGLLKEHPESYHSFMYNNFFNHVDIQPQNINILNGNTEDHDEECRRYEEKIKSYGKINLFMGGVGVDGHIAFNEPASSLSSRTRIKTLTKDTLIANSRFFDNDVNKVPKYALTIGVATLLDAEEVMILATGHPKALAVQAAVEGSVNHLWTVSALQLHRHFILVTDEAALQELKVKTVKYFTELEERAIHSVL